MKVDTWTEQGIFSVQTNDPVFKREIHRLLYKKAYRPIVPSEYMVFRTRDEDVKIQILDILNKDFSKAVELLKPI